MAFTLLQQGNFTSAGVGVRIALPGSADYFVTNNLTQAITQANPGVGVKFEWYNGLTAADAAIEWKKTNSTDALNMVGITSGGFTYVTTYPTVEAQAANAITAITAASPAVFSQTNTYSEGDIIRIYGTTGMLQYAGIDIQISSVSGSGYTAIGLRAAGLTAGSAGFTRRISRFSAVLPESLYITEITKASSAVVRTSIDPTLVYVVGMKVHFSVPASFGMTQMNGLTGTITALSSANYTMTVNIDSTAFTTFAFPLTTASPTAQLFATVAPAGASTQYNTSTGVQTGYDFNSQSFRTSQFVPFMYLAAGAQSPAGQTSDVIVYQAWKKEN